MFEAEEIPMSVKVREELGIEEEDEDEEEEERMVPGDPEKARQVYERGYKYLKRQGLKEEVCALLLILFLQLM